MGRIAKNLVRGIKCTKCLLAREMVGILTFGAMWRSLSCSGDDFSNSCFGYTPVSALPRLGMCLYGTMLGVVNLLGIHTDYSLV